MPTTVEQFSKEIAVYAFFEPAYMPCVECGASVAHAERDVHVCDVERKLDFLLFQHRNGVAAFELDLAAWLTTPAGRFAAWYAERARRDGDPPEPA